MVFPLTVVDPGRVRLQLCLDRHPLAPLVLGRDQDHLQSSNEHRAGEGLRPLLWSLAMC